MTQSQKVQKLKLPPIQYLPAFEAAARHSSFKLAAHELNITPSAISQQIKSLETQLGQLLFDRSQRHLKLTDSGTDFLNVANATLKSYRKTFQTYNASHCKAKLTVSMIPFIANEIIISRLAEFNKKYPEVKLIINTNMDEVDFFEQDIDGAIRFGTPPWADLKAEKICDASSALVATKEYFNQNPIRHKKDWQKQTLIHCRRNHNDWETLMAMTGYQFIPKSELHFDCYESGMRAAESGLGLAMAIFPISLHKIKSGKLSMLTDKTYPSKDHFYFVTKPDSQNNIFLQEFFTWIHSLFKMLEEKANY